MTTGRLRIKRAYESPSRSDGYRVLVDRLWPRGVSRDAAKLDGWLRNIEPTPQLRAWWRHDPARLEEFARRYGVELDSSPAVNELRRRLRDHPTVTLLYAAHDPQVNHAAMVRDYLRPHGDRKE